MAPRTRTTRRGRQSQAATEKVVSENVHLNTIYRLLDTQIKKEQAFQATDDGEVDTRNVLLAGIDKGSENLCAAIDELLQDPFGDTRPGMVFNDNERRALRTFHNALTAEISTRSATTKDSLMTANKLLVEQFDPRPDETGRHTEWQPRRFRIVDPDDDDYDETYISSSDEEHKLDLNKIGKGIPLIALPPISKRSDEEIAGGKIRRQGE